MVLDGLLEPRLVVGINAALLPFGGPLARALHPLARVFSRLPMLHTLAAARARRPGAVERLIAGTGSRLSEEGIAAYRRLLGSEEHVVATLAMMASWDLDGLLADLPRLSAPLCLLVGSRDFAVPPSQAERIRERFRDPLYTVHIRRLPGLGHLAHEERPDRVAEAIRACEMREEKS
jgi:magnesium chelatase accessory protein